jgi:putative membrane protein
MSGAERVWDPGLQPERTSLAWQRMALTFLGLGLVVPRVAWPALGVWSLLPAALVLAAAVAVLVVSHRRYRAAHRVLTSGDGRLHDGRLPLLVAVTALVLAALALAFVLVAG